MCSFDAVVIYLSEHKDLKPCLTDLPISAAEYPTGIGRYLRLPIYCLISLVTALTQGAALLVGTLLMTSFPEKKRRVLSNFENSSTVAKMFWR